MPGGARDVAFFGDAAANVYALDAATGKQLWKTDVDDFPVGRISGSPTLLQRTHLRRCRIRRRSHRRRAHV